MTQSKIRRRENESEEGCGYVAQGPEEALSEELMFEEI